MSTTIIGRVPPSAAAPPLDSPGPAENPAGLQSGPRSWGERFFTFDGLALGLSRALQRLLLALARTASSFVQRKGWSELGHARVEDYAREELHRSGRWLRDLAALGAALDQMPCLEKALTGGDGRRPLGQVAALALARLAPPESIQAWVDRARSVTFRTLRDELRTAAKKGSLQPPCSGSPKEPPGPSRSSGAEPGREGGAAASSTSGAGQEPADPGQREAGPGTKDPQPEAWSVATVPAPYPLRVLLEETRVLHKAVCGRETSEISLEEALLAESQTGSRPEDTELTPWTPRALNQARRKMEEDVFENTGGFSHLRSEPSPEESAALELLHEARDLISRAGEGGAAELHGRLKRWIALEEQLQQELGRILVEMGVGRGFRPLEFTGLGHYAEQRLGLKRTTARDRVAVARSVEDHPVLLAAYDKGRLGFQSALLLLRALRNDLPLLDRKSEQAWVDHAGSVTVKRLRDELRLETRRRLTHPRDGNPQGKRPPADREWYASLRLAPGDMRQRVKELGRQAAEAGAGADLLRFKLPENLAGPFLAAMESRRRRLVQAAEEEQAMCAERRMFSTGRPRFPEATAGERTSGTGARKSFAETVLAGRPQAVSQTGSRMPGGPETAPRRMFSTPEEGPSPPAAGHDRSVALEVAGKLLKEGFDVPAWVGLLSLLEDYILTWDEPAAVPWRRSNRIYVRDGWRCVAPGCTSRQNLESHHVVYRAHGGDLKAEWNQICLCRFHHQQGEHGGLASVRGRAPLGLLWRLGRPGAASFYRNERRIGTGRDRRGEV